MKKFKIIFCVLFFSLLSFFIIRGHYLIKSNSYVESNNDVYNQLQGSDMFTNGIKNMFLISGVFFTLFIIIIIVIVFIAYKHNDDNYDFGYINNKKINKDNVEISNEIPCNGDIFMRMHYLELIYLIYIMIIKI